MWYVLGYFSFRYFWLILFAIIGVPMIAGALLTWLVRPKSPPD